MVALKKEIKNIQKYGVQGNFMQFKDQLLNISEDFYKNPVASLEIFKKEAENARKSVPADVSSNANYEIYKEYFSELLMKYINDKKINEKEAKEYIVNSLTEIQILNSYAILYSRIKHMREMQHKKISDSPYYMFQTLLYFGIYERICYRIKSLYIKMINTNKSPSKITNGTMLKVLKKQEKYSKLFESMDNNIRNAIAHGTFIINERDGQFIFSDYNIEVKKTYEEFNKMLWDARCLLFSIFICYLNYFENSITSNKNSI